MLPQYIYDLSKHGDLDDISSAMEYLEGLEESQLIATATYDDGTQRPFLQLAINGRKELETSLMALGALLVEESDYIIEVYVTNEDIAVAIVINLLTVKNTREPVYIPYELYLDENPYITDNFSLF